MTKATAAGGARVGQRAARTNFGQAFLTFATGALVLFMGVIWWLSPPGFDAVSIRECILRCLDVVFLILYVAVWIITPFIGFRWLACGGLALARLGFIAARNCRLRAIARARAERQTRQRPERKPARIGRQESERRIAGTRAASRARRVEPTRRKERYPSPHAVGW